MNTETKKVSYDAYWVIDQDERLALCARFPFMSLVIDPYMSDSEEFQDAYKNLRSCMETILDEQATVCIKKKTVQRPKGEGIDHIMQSIPDITRDEIISNWEIIKTELPPYRWDEESVKAFDKTVSLLRIIPNTIAEMEASNG